jgi:hypothetical protein
LAFFNANLGHAEITPVGASSVVRSTMLLPAGDDAMTNTHIKPVVVRLSAAAQAVLKQEAVQLDTNATANIVHALKFR